MDRIGDFLPKILKKKLLDKSVQAAQVVDIFKDVAVEVLGSDLVRYIAQVNFKDNVLCLHVLNSVVAQELQIKKLDLLEKINNLTGEKVEDVRFRIGFNSEQGA